MHCRAKIILESVLEQASRLRLTHLFIDISGVPVVDTMVAYQLFKVVDSAKLLGIETIISGIRPEIAQTVVKLGIDFSKVNTEHSLAKALEKEAFVSLKSSSKKQREPKNVTSKSNGSVDKEKQYNEHMNETTNSHTDLVSFFIHKSDTKDILYLQISNLLRRIKFGDTSL